MLSKITRGVNRRGKGHAKSRTKHEESAAREKSGSSISLPTCHIVLPLAALEPSIERTEFGAQLLSWVRWLAMGNV